MWDSLNPCETMGTSGDPLGPLGSVSRGPIVREPEREPRTVSRAAAYRVK